jgi:TM2 domain-containing membrane protein YozV
MDTYQNPYMNLPGISPEELSFLQQATAGLDENQLKYFFTIYMGKRKSPQDILIFCIVSIFIPGVQRFVLGQVGMAVLYFFTGGLFFVMTIMDLINYKKLALEFNKKMAYESYQLVKMGS